MKLRSILPRALSLLCVATLMVFMPMDADARTGKKKSKGKSAATPALQRVPASTFEVIRNKISNVEFFMSNYGIFGYDVLGRKAGGFWPRRSNNAYIFGGGVWFGAQKNVNGETKSLSVIGYDPNKGSSWMTPGTIGDPDESPNKYRLYFSSDYDPFSGEPVDPVDNRNGGTNWPIWDMNPGDTLRYSRYLGYYLDDTTKRNRAVNPKGPAIISDEDIFSVYKDTDLGKYDGEDEPGHPFNIQIEQTIYSWGFGPTQLPSTPVADITRPYKDMIFLKYEIINKSLDTFMNCYMAPAMDMDIGDAGNDRNKIAIEKKAEDTLNLAVQWSDDEANKTFGYIGYDFLESPAVDPVTRFIRHDKRVYTGREQIGLTTFQNWIIAEDPLSPAERYEFMASPDRDGDNNAGDKRFLMSTGPFNMMPGDTARVVLGIMFAYAAKPPGLLPDGTWPDMRKIIAVDSFAQVVYDNNFLAPTPPARATLSYRPLDGGVELSWNEVSERSSDYVENGLDFAGYLIQRQRAPSARFSPKDTLEGWNIGWKTIARIDLPKLPSDTARAIASQTGLIGSLGAWWRVPMLMDRCGTLCFTFDPYDDNNDTTLRQIYYNMGRADLVDRYDTLGRACPTCPGQFKALLDTTISTIVRDAIVDIIDSMTGGHKYVDVGDDNSNNTINVDEADLEANELLLNNVSYEYRLLAFDAGLASEGTAPKTNSGVFGINHIKATPEAPPPSRGIEPFVVPLSGLGSISNFRFMVLDENRLGQLFGGDTLEFEFNPLDRYPLPQQYFPQQAYFYMNEVTVRRRSNGQEITRFIVPYIFNNRFVFSDRGEEMDGLDTIFANNPYLAVPYAGTFTADPDESFFGTSSIYKSTFGISFDYHVTQFGDSLMFGRFGDTLTRLNPFTRITPSNADVNLVAADQYHSLNSTDPVAYTALPSIGQIKLEIEFLPGGVETLTSKRNNRDFVFPDVPYLNVRVKNIASYTREIINPTTGRPDSIVTNYNYEFPLDPNAKTTGDTTKTREPLTRLIDPGYYALYAYGWMNLDTLTSHLPRRRQVDRARLAANSQVRPMGTPGRYYLGTSPGYEDTTGQARQTISFTHRLVVNGAEVILDFAGMGAADPQFARWDTVKLPATPPTRDFAVGDKIVVDFTGGVLGLPEPGAKVLVVIPDPKPEIVNAETGRNYSNDMLDQIKVVPNPYLVTHLGQRSNSENLLYFTRLPERCTIEIYTEAGELLTTLLHEAQPGGRRAVNAWDLLTKANRKSASQLLIARITTPNGSETIKKFAIVVGGFRIVE